ncbi:hypothetical protein G4B88_013500 [Cannabis sativa]|uniref:Reverse transcriptase zinc-binding domain-containing protein n=1 Tax=Cannabis sativa TaxID=3483 RepID=A0A7J6HKG0_CANSA|nr:hypothetical protein G4B88_013500 [Cannabis sativa]
MNHDPIRIGTNMNPMKKVRGQNIQSSFDTVRSCLITEAYMAPNESKTVVKLTKLYLEFKNNVNFEEKRIKLFIPFNHEDSWFWHYTSNGNYTVGSGYNTAMTLDKSLSSSASDVFSLWWKQFWGLKMPRNFLHFAWRGFHEILPTRNGLNKRNIVSNNSCELCGFGGESNAHAIFWCPFAQEI